MKPEEYKDKLAEAIPPKDLEVVLYSLKAALYELVDTPASYELMRIILEIKKVVREVDKNEN